jgi:hypothetical protein
MCLQSSTNRGLLDLLCANVSGLTINGYVDTYIYDKTKPLISLIAIQLKYTSVIVPVGSLKNRLNEWRLMIHNQYILDIIENGYEWLKYAVLRI